MNKKQKTTVHYMLEEYDRLGHDKRAFADWFYRLSDTLMKAEKQMLQVAFKEGELNELTLQAKGKPKYESSEDYYRQAYE